MGISLADNFLTGNDFWRIFNAEFLDQLRSPFL